MKKRLKRLRDGASDRLKDLAGKAKQLEGVLNDLKSRDFMQSPKIQELMAKVTVKGLNVVPIMTRAGEKKQGSSSKKKPISESAFRGRLKALENQINPQVARGKWIERYDGERQAVAHLRRGGSGEDPDDDILILRARSGPDRLDEQIQISRVPGPKEIRFQPLNEQDPAKPPNQIPILRLP